MSELPNSSPEKHILTPEQLRLSICEQLTVGDGSYPDGWHQNPEQLKQFWDAQRYLNCLRNIPQSNIAGASYNEHRLTIDQMPGTNPDSYWEQHLAYLTFGANPHTADSFLVLPAGYHGREWTVGREGIRALLSDPKIAQDAQDNGTCIIVLPNTNPHSVMHGLHNNLRGQDPNRYNAPLAPRPGDPTEQAAHQHVWDLALMNNVTPEGEADTYSAQQFIQNATTLNQEYSQDYQTYFLQGHTQPGMAFSTVTVDSQSYDKNNLDSLDPTSAALKHILHDLIPAEHKKTPLVWIDLHSNLPHEYVTGDNAWDAGDEQTTYVFSRWPYPNNIPETFASQWQQPLWNELTPQQYPSPLHTKDQGSYVIPENERFSFNDNLMCLTAETPTMPDSLITNDAAYLVEYQLRRLWYQTHQQTDGPTETQQKQIEIYHKTLQELNMQSGTISDPNQTMDDLQRLMQEVLERLSS